MRLFKVLDADGFSTYQGEPWHLPKGKRPGKWMEPIEGDLVPCRSGYHLCRERDLIRWLGATIYEAEYRGEIVEADGKVVVREVRLVSRLDHWNDRTARLFACWCAEQVLPVFERQHPDDSRVRECIETARKVADGDLPASALAAAGDAARAAAWDAAWDAAGDAAWDAAGAAAGDAAWAAAWDAAGAAAGAAAWDAARAAAGDAAGDAQTRALFHLLDTGALPA